MPSQTIEPNVLELNNDCPTVLLDGKDWPIPMLAVKQLKKITPILARYFDKMSAMKETTEDDLKHKMVSLFDEQLIDDMILVVHTGLTRAHPEMTRDYFEDMSVSLVELMNAMQVIVKQTGVFTPVDPNQKKMKMM